MSFVQQDQVFRTKITRQGNDELVTTLEQPSRGLILERNAQLRNNHGALNDLTFGRQMASIPFEDWEYFMRKNPNYRMMCKEDREKALFDFLKFDERGRACMVVDEGSNKKYHTINTSRQI